jgi:hypothetical protein
MQQLRQKRPRLKLSFEEYNLLRDRVLERDGGGAKNAVHRKNCRSIISLREAS